MLSKMASAVIRVGQGFWVYGIQGSYKSGIRYIYAEIWILSISFVLFTTPWPTLCDAWFGLSHLCPGLNTTSIFTTFRLATNFTKNVIFRHSRNFRNFRKIRSSR